MGNPMSRRVSANHRRRLLVYTAMLGLVQAAAAHAAPQARPAATASQPEQKAEATTTEALAADIVVTARKRSETAQDVPIALSAFGSAQLDAIHARTLQDLQTSLPAVRLDAAASPGVANFTIRGLGVNSSIPTIEPTVGTFVDGVYLGTNYGVVLDNFDLQSVEVLRGPQGVLFGKNVTGGAVLLTNKRPSLTRGLAVDARASYETGEHYTLAASANVPLGSTLAGRITGYYTRDHGWFHNDLTGRRVGGQETYLVRPSLLWHPTDAFTTTLIVEHGRSTGDGPVLQNSKFQSGFTINTDLPGSLRLKWTQVTSETNLNVGFGNGTITNIFGYRAVKHGALGDFDGLPQNLFHAIFALDQDQRSEELRYHGTFFDDVLDVTTGLYYFNQNLVYRERRFIRAVVDSSFGGDQTENTYGAFGSADVKIAPTLTITAGVRYTTDRKNAQIASFVVRPSSCNPIDIALNERTCRFNFAGRATFNNFSPKFGVTWKPTRDYTIYGSFARGNRSGGFNVRNTSTPSSAGPTQDEVADSFEVGAKTENFDRHLRLNVAAFTQKISNLQRETNISDPVAGVIQAFRNTADARISGIEVDGLAIFSDRFSIDFSGGYQDGHYKRVLVDLNGDKVINDIDLGLRLPRLARVSANVGANLEFPFAPTGGELSFRASYSYLDGSAFTDSNSTFLRSADIVNANVRLSGTGGWDVSVYGKNLLNSVSEGTNAPTPFGGFRSLNKGRVIGVELNAHF